MTVGQRRLAAIVAADVAGYSRLMGANEEETIAFLHAHRTEVIDPKLAKYRGRIANTAGDSLLIEFPSAVDALRCSIEVQQGIAVQNENVPEDRRIRYRIGINVGDVVSQGADLLGDGVNVAARLEGLAEPGGICLSRAARDQVRDRLDVTLKDLGEIEVKNIARPVRAFQVLADGIETPPNNRRRISARRIAAASAAGLVVFAGLGIWMWQDRFFPEAGTVQAVKRTDAPSIAVLPFTDRSDDQDQSYFADGITEDITTDLSKVSGLNVTSRLATLRFRNNADDPLAIAARLGVGHILEGSIRRSGGKVRITAKLVDAKTGDQLWAERYDRETQDIFTIQDEIADRVVAQLSNTFQGISLNREVRSYTPDVEAYDHYIQGRAKRIPPTPKNLAAALQSFDRAIEIDPKFAGGYAGASFAHILLYADSTEKSKQPADHLNTALRLAEKAVELDPDFGPAWGSLAEAHFRRRKYDEALEAIQKALKLAPSDSLMRARYGRFLGHVGRAEDGIAEVKTAMRMSPDSLPMLYFLGANYRAAGDFGNAIDSLTEHRRRLGGRILPGPTSQLIAAYVQAGMMDQARTEAAALLQAAPHYTATQASRTHPYREPEDDKLFLQALQEAGLPV